MFDGMDAVGPGQTPVRQDVTVKSAYFLLWMVTGSCFAVNLFVEAVVTSFQRQLLEQGTDATLTNVQRQWMEVRPVLTIVSQGR